jgi:HK97 family phage major capsid protein
VSPITETPPGTFGHGITPEAWADFVLQHISVQSVVLASGATRVDTINRAIHIPRIKTDGAADWFAEMDVITEADPTGDDLILTPKKVAALVTLSAESVDDSNPSILDAVGTSMTRAVALKADQGILTSLAGSSRPAFLARPASTTSARQSRSTA